MLLSKHGAMLGVWLSLCSLVFNGHQYNQKDNQIYSVYVGHDNDVKESIDKLSRQVEDLKRLTRSSMRAYVNSAAYQQFCLEQKRLKDKEKQLEKELKDKHAMHDFGMSIDSLKELIKNRSEKLIELLIANEKLSKSQIINIYNEHCLKKWFYDGYNDPIRDKLLAMYDRRVADKNRLEGQRQAEQAFALQQEQSDQMLSNELAVYHMQRWDALELTRTSDWEAYNQCYRLHPQTVYFLQSCNIDTELYQQLFGTAIQHQLHAEFCKIVEEAAKFSHLPYQFNLLQQVVLQVDLGVESNRAALIDLAAVLADSGHGLVGCIRQISKESVRLLGVAGEQAIDSMFKLPEAVVHGIVATYDLLCMVKDHAVQFDEINYFDYGRVTPNISDRYADRIATISNCYQHVSTVVFNWLATRSMAQKSEDVVKFVTDTGITVVVPEIILSKAICVLRSCVDILKHSRVVQKASQVLSKEEKFVAISEEALIKFEQSTTQLMEFEVEEQKAACGCVEKMRAKKPVNNRVTEQSLIEKAAKEAENYFKVPQKILDEIQSFAEKYKYIEVELDGVIEIVEVDWNHILLPTAKSRTHFNRVTKLSELKNIEVSGWHYGLWKDFEKQGLIKIVKKVERNGCIYLEIDWPYGRKSFEKTFYPESWDYLKIKDKIIEVSRSVVLSINKDGKFKNLSKTLIGKTLDGIEMKIELARDVISEPWTIKTAYVPDSYILYGKK